MDYAMTRPQSGRDVSAKPAAPKIGGKGCQTPDTMGVVREGIRYEIGTMDSKHASVVAEWGQGNGTDPSVVEDYIVDNGEVVWL